MKAANKPAENLTPLLLDAKAASRLCACGLTHWYALDQKGAIPQAVVLGKRVWAREILEMWCRAGCPRRDDPRWLAILSRLRGEVDNG